MGSPAKVSGLLYSKQRVSAVPTISKNAVEIRTILLCRVRLLKNLPPFCLQFFYYPRYIPPHYIPQPAQNNKRGGS